MGNLKERLVSGELEMPTNPRNASEIALDESINTHKLITG